MNAYHYLATLFIGALTLGQLACATGSDSGPSSGAHVVDGQYSLHIMLNKDHPSTPDCKLTQLADKATMRCKSGEVELGAADPEHLKLRALISEINWAKEANAKRNNEEVGGSVYTLMLVDGGITYKVQAVESKLGAQLKELVEHVHSYESKIAQTLQKKAQGPCLEGQRFNSCPGDPSCPQCTVCGPPLCYPAQAQGLACSADIHCESGACQDSVCVAR